MMPTDPDGVALSTEPQTSKKPGVQKKKKINIHLAKHNRAILALVTTTYFPSPHCFKFYESSLGANFRALC